MVSISEDLLERIDGCARARGTSRSGLLRDLAAQELAREDGSQGALIDDLLGDAGHYGGNGAAEIRKLRDNR